MQKFSNVFGRHSSGSEFRDSTYQRSVDNTIRNKHFAYNAIRNLQSSRSCSNRLFLIIDIENIFYRHFVPPTMKSLESAFQSTHHCDIFIIPEMETVVNQSYSSHRASQKTWYMALPLSSPIHLTAFRSDDTAF